MKKGAKHQKNHSLLESLSVLMGHYFLSVFWVGLGEAVLLNCDRFGLHLRSFWELFASPWP